MYEQAIRVPSVDQVIVATDDARIYEAVEQFGGIGQMITTPCRTGTDRVAAISDSLDSEVLVNWQADEIVLNPAMLHDLIDSFLAHPVPIGTLKRTMTDHDDFLHPAVVKVVTDQASGRKWPARDFPKDGRLMPTRRLSPRKTPRHQSQK